MHYYHLVALGLLLVAAGSCKQAATSGAPATRIAGPNEALFPIIAQGRWGFIDSTGAVVIAPRFAEVRPFAGGLAPAREVGHYGYINTAGQFVLPPRYSYAGPFQGNVALVYTDSTLQLIDRTGRQVPLPAAYKRLEWYAQDGLRGFWVGTRSDFKSQLLTAGGRVLNATWFKEVGKLSNNRLVVTTTAPATDPNGPAETELVGAVDGQGKLVIPYRRFDQISTFRNGLATATLYQRVYDEKSRQECIIDTTGRILSYLSSQKYFIGNEGFSDGVMKAGLITRVVDELNSESYPVALDRQGQPLFRHAWLRFLGSYGHNRAWASGAGDGWHLLDKAGRARNKVAVQAVLAPGLDEAPTFVNGVELVQLANDQGYAALDTMGQVVSRLRGSHSGYRDPERRGNILVFYADSVGRMGFWNWRTGFVLKPRFSAIAPAGYQHGLLAIVEDHRLGYLSPAGHYVWREAPKTSAPLNIDCQRRSFYTVASLPLPRYRGVSGWAPSGNVAKPIALWQFSLPRLTMHVSTASRPMPTRRTSTGMP
jgi:hypothetical protein